MEASEVWSLLEALEQRPALERNALEALFGASFEASLDHNRQPILVATPPRYELELRIPKGPSHGDLTIRFSEAVTVDPGAVLARFPGGSSLPPPPPGCGPAEAQGAYVAERPWGQIWFTFYTGNRLVQISIAPGRRGSPGV